MSHSIEVLSPAGDIERLRMAAAYGADALYLGGKRFGMRAAPGNFNTEELREAVRYLHGLGRRAYVTVNTMPGNSELCDLAQHIGETADCGADAFVVADLGVLAMIKRLAPAIPVHVSTQAGTVNYEAARVWHELGASRIVLARELHIGEIAEIRAKTPPELSLESFVHGAMCMAYSGRCLLSRYLTGRDANRGECAQACRWKYFLVEEKRPGSPFEIYEGHEGAHILNARDLCMVEHLDKLRDAGVTAFKIEGRAKSSYYAAVTTHAYKMAAGDLLAGREFDTEWLSELEKVSHREYTTGFYFGEGGGQIYENSSYIRLWDVCAVVTGHRGGVPVLIQKNRFLEGDELELLRPSRRAIRVVAADMCDMDGNPLRDVTRPHMEFTMGLNEDMPVYSILRKRTGSPSRA